VFQLVAGQSRRRRASVPLAAVLSAVATPTRVAQGRAGLGALMIAQPASIPRALGVPREAAEQTAWATQMLGAREVALGLGTWVALRRPDRRAARLWLAAGLLSDAVDAVAVARAVGRGSVRPASGWALVGVAVTATAVEAAALAGDSGRR
jgi:hypothetical protein